MCKLCNIEAASMDDVVGVRVHIHPVALFSIVDSYERRQDANKRVIGTLLGAKEKGVVEIRSGYAVPHNETDEEVAVDMDFEKEMCRLHQRVNPSESVVGWYSTFATAEGASPPTLPEGITHSVLIHDYYSRLTTDLNCTFVTVDTTLRNGRLSFKAYVKSKVGLPGKTEGTIFTPVPCDVVYFDPERVAVDQMMSSTAARFAGPAPLPATPSPVLSDFAQIEKAAEAIEGMLSVIMKYVKDVIAGNIPADSAVGRLLMETISKVPRIEGAQFEAMLNSTMQDLLMVVYLANLTKTQVNLGEKLSQLPS